MSKEIKKVSLLETEYTSRSIRYPLIIDELSSLSGEILTIIDASIPDGKQNKAMKDLIRSKFSHKMNNVFWDYCYRKIFDYSHDGFLSFNIVEGTQSQSEQKFNINISRGAQGETATVAG